MSGPAEALAPEAVLNVIIGRYGETSNAALMARLAWLLELIADDERTEGEWEPLRSRIEEHYTLEEPIPSSVAAHIAVRDAQDGSPVYSFSSDEYLRRYADAPVADPLEIHDSTDVAALADQRWRMFVITPDDELLVHPRAMDVTELVMNRNDDDSGVPLVHPTLVRSRGLAIKAAGEMAFARTGAGHLGAVFNTKSGHFCPAPETSDAVLRKVGAMIGTSRLAAIPVRLRVPAAPQGA